MARPRRRLAASFGFVVLASAGRPARAQAPGRVDLGARVGYALPVGALDRGTHALDTSFGGLPVAVDAAIRLGPPRRWDVELGFFASVAPTVPALCATVSSCFGSVGRDFEVDVLARFRGPRLGFLLPEVEIGPGWSWLSRSLDDGDVRSTRHWSGPVFARGAFVPSFVLGRTSRLGVVLGGSIGGTASSHLRGPGLDQSGLRGGVHGTLDVGVRLGFDLMAPTDGPMERNVLGR